MSKHHHHANYWMKADFTSLKKHGYQVLKELGRGGYGIVYKAQHGIDKQNLWAIKINFNTISRDNICVEVALLTLIRNRSRLALMKETFVEKNVYYIVLEYFPSHPFITYFTDLSFSETKHYIYELLIGLKQLKDLGVQHRDIKPGNFIYNRHAKRGMIIDYGLAEINEEYHQDLKKKFSQYDGEDVDDFDEEEFQEYHKLKSKLKIFETVSDCLKTLGRNKVGTESFVPLETILEIPNQSYSSDMWPVGVIFLQFVARRYTIFSHLKLPTDKKIKPRNNYCVSFILELAAIFGIEPVEKQLREWDFQVQFPPIKFCPLKDMIAIPDFSEEGMDFLSRVLDINPKTRLSVEEALEHPLFEEVRAEHIYK